MKEDFLHYLWRLQRFDQSNLCTSKGVPIQILAIGEHNQHAGPDFSNARVRIGDTLWAGNIEIHIKSSEWMEHQHQKDPAYDNVILHVVLEENMPIFDANGTLIPCLELKHRVSPGLAKNYLRLLQQENWIPCQSQLSQVPEMTKELWMDRLLVERLEEKTKAIKAILLQSNYNWEETFYRFLARSYGLKINPDAFEQLANALPLTLLGRHKNQLRQIEALLFGQAGMLDKNFVDEYPQQLQQEYFFLQKKYKLQPIPTSSWKFLRLRPANFPTIRLAQFAMLIHQSTHLFSKILALQKVKEVENMFDRRVSLYWQEHYVFDKISPKRNKTLGRSTIHLFVINTIAPFLFLYGQEMDEEKYKDKALELLEELKPEKNKIIKQWKSLGMNPKSAFQSQALLQLKKHYCDPRKCLSCPIGHQLLNQ